MKENKKDKRARVKLILFNPPYRKKSPPTKARN